MYTSPLPLLYLAVPWYRADELLRELDPGLSEPPGARGNLVALQPDQQGAAHPSDRGVDRGERGGSSLSPTVSHIDIEILFHHAAFLFIFY